MEERHKIKNQKHKHVLELYRSKGEHYICACLNKNDNSTTNVRRIPGGLLYTRQWNNMQYVSNAAFLLSLYSDCLISPSGGRMLSRVRRLMRDLCICQISG